MPHNTALLFLDVPKYSRLLGLDYDRGRGPVWMFLFIKHNFIVSDLRAHLLYCRMPINVSMEEK